MSATSIEDVTSGAGLDWVHVQGDAKEQQVRPPPRKRRRIVISCTECHRRKQKCDRKLPCTNCVSRNKDSSCRYETGAPTAKQHGRRAITGVTTAPDDVARKHDSNRERTTTTAAAATFGYSHTSANTLGFLHRIESTATVSSAHPDNDDGDDEDHAAAATDTIAIIPDPHNPPSRTSTTTSTVKSPDNRITASTNSSTTLTPAERTLRDRYKTLIRQLPARCAIEKLAEFYFAEFNPQYAMLDRNIFDAQLAAWYRLPFSQLSTGPGPAALSREMRAFPAVVFQICAVALLVLEDVDVAEDGTRERAVAESFAGLKYAGGMTFEDLAREYSDCGVELLAVLGKREMALNTVVAGWVRASWLKYVGLVTESWHAVGSAIRDAQEIGLHRDSLDPRPASNDAEAVLENQWEIQRRRIAWMTLVQWDVHMACVLGRPTTTDLSMAPPSLPVDAPVPKDRSKTPVLPRGENDPPTPVTRTIWAYHIMRPLREILEMEKDGPCPKDFSRVDRLHNELLDLDARTPAFFRLENPDTRFDSLPECAWLPLSRVVFPQLISFELMALHRPYIFTRPKSRTEALKASLDMLHTQRLNFQALKPQMYKTFSVFFGTFDAIVLMASIYILFPKEHPDMVQRAVQHFHWAVERFEAMSTRNSLAKAALGVLHAICLRMSKALGLSKLAAQKLLIPGSASTSPANGSVDGSTASSTVFSPCTTASYNPSPSMGSSRTSMSTAAVSTSGDDLSPSQHCNLNGVPQQGVCCNTNTDFASAPSNPPPAPAPDFNFDLDPDLFAINPSTSSSNTNNDNPFDWNPPSDFDWSSLQPIYATSDLVYHNLSRTISAAGGSGGGGTASIGWDYQGQQQQQHATAYDGGTDTVGVQCSSGEAPSLVAAGGGGIGLGTTPDGSGTGAAPAFCQFGGDFGDDSVWNLLNHYSPY
ncbi:hypothetical protein C7999DRAFT_17908 [Corynascus novoguineensis]|uniref:Zn(2)-C6 fungal-type domain-containing protein n=1 Tax=Corynascus novoguineensis TaxID=1126955 RepID=A0AAN7CMJ2_9PEZI|nr:hypothetical protein C7999DRAFT_17908 [Corynascus novoguineensis]